MSKCNKCGQEIKFYQRKNGKWFPCVPQAVEPTDVNPDDYIMDAMTGNLVKATDAYVGGVWHLSHFAVCPYAEPMKK